MSVSILLISAAGTPLARTVAAANEQYRLSLTVIGCVDTLADALATIKQHFPQIVLIDAATPGISPSHLCRQLTEVSRNTKVLVLLNSQDDRELVRTLTSGASGCLRKPPTALELCDCIQTILRNRLYIGAPPSRGDTTGDRTAAPSDLSKREIEVLALLADGAKTREIAASLFVTEKTVETHRSHIMRKLGIHSIAELTKFAVKHGLTGLNGN